MAEVIGGFTNNFKVDKVASLPRVEVVSKTITYTNGSSGILTYYPDGITAKFVLATGRDGMAILYHPGSSNSITLAYNHWPGIGSMNISARGESNRITWSAYNSSIGTGSTTASIGLTYILW